MSKLTYIITTQTQVSPPVFFYFFVDFIKICIQDSEIVLYCLIYLKMEVLNNGKKVTRASEEIVKKIKETDDAIEEAKENVKSLRSQKKQLMKELKTTQKEEAKIKEMEDIKDLLELMKEKDISVDDLKKLVE